MSVDGSITGSSSQVLVLTVWDMEVSLRVAILLGQTEINDIDLVTTLADAHEEVIRLDITVDEGLRMDVLDSRDELIGQKEHGLQGELAVAEVEKVLQAGAEKIQDHSIVVALGSEPTNEGDTDTSGERLVDAGFIFELRVLGFDTLELDGDFFTRDDVRSEVDVTERAAADLSSDPVLVPHAEILRNC